MLYGTDLDTTALKNEQLTCLATASNE